ncbi:triphosphoribosyl-dephospho-CoA synthase CitG [Acetobacter thailandicus]|uniref:triphosphoribosyl-dephospho-CoA synthase CitG n=1 Tax=Acetobacter thailandicus TaxID=1502842 RepID=UPI001BAD6DED|nr:triphosphoribosyl-dephospho-CoA synthase CitG [Acetobacter thailandicus]
MINAATISDLARYALLREVSLSPKPGLVDRYNNGAHTDMDYALFLLSIDAISPFFKLFYEQGSVTANLSPPLALQALRKTGIACEQAMFKATGGVNTHKGAVFALGLLCGAAGRLTAKHHTVNVATLCAEVSAICHNLTEKDLGQAKRNNTLTAGEKIYLTYGLSGARGEAEGGFATVRRYALPAYTEALTQGMPADHAELISLLTLMSYNEDTNVISRAGLSGLKFVQQQAQKILFALKEEGDFDLRHQTEALNAAFTSQGISPGGSADLLSVMLFLYYIQVAFSKGEGASAERESVC